ncbi:olfactory receptor 142-like [Electrophorus electricus]|uniref:olfactory receptor 142-like n=1 Tax=Electrophorus electricus TaxID=8005 RepID=UPI0015CFC27F|nr:olfactory receptor 142-like [Electrophorus electricus]
MQNYSSEFMFVLHGLNDTRAHKQIYFAVGLVVYVVTLFVNFTLIITVILDKTLHEPMYLFICNLYVNGIGGASAFYPKFLADLFSDSHVISYTGCLSQICSIYWYIFCEFTSLTVMAYDRYLAICKPLEYHCIMTHQMVIKLLLCIWLFSFLETSVGVSLTAQLSLCGNGIDKLYCFNWDVVKLSCTDATVINLYGYIVMFSHSSQAVFIIISYIRIIKASLKSKTERVKFMQTCLPHLITLTNFTISLLLDILCARYGKGDGLRALRNILGIEFLVVPPLLNPIIYGIRITQIRSRFVKMYSYKINTFR